MQVLHKSFVASESYMRKTPFRLLSALYSPKFKYHYQKSPISVNGYALAVITTPPQT